LNGMTFRGPHVPISGYLAVPSSTALRSGVVVIDDLVGKTNNVSSGAGGCQTTDYRLDPRAEPSGSIGRQPASRE